MLYDRIDDAIRDSVVVKNIPEIIQAREKNDCAMTGTPSVSSGYNARPRCTRQNLYRSTSAPDTWTSTVMYDILYPANAREPYGSTVNSTSRVFQYYLLLKKSVIKRISFFIYHCY